MKLRLRSIWLALMMCALTAGCTATTEAGVNGSGNNKAGVSMRVLWTVSSYRLGSQAVMTDEVARTFLFKPLDIDSERIVFGDQQCSKVRFTRRVVRLREYLEGNWHITPQALGVDEQSATVVSTNCDIPLFGEYLHLHNGTIIGQLQGGYFFFEPNVQK